MSEQVKLEIVLDSEIVEWVDSVKDQLELRDRGSVINRLLREIKGSEN
jgi:hypothetical protein